MSACISAVQHVRQLRGGSQSQLLRASDGLCYVTKFQTNPQHIRVLANEMLATRLARALGLPVPHVTQIEVPQELIEHTPELGIETAGVRTSFQPGLQLAAAFVEGPNGGQVFDYLPEGLLKRVENIQDFCRILALDKWTSNADSRQAIFTRTARRRATYSATFIESGKRASLLALSPLRTGHESFPSSGSSRS